MNDDELDLWLSAHNEELDARVNARIDLELRRQRVRSATESEPHDDDPDLAEVHAIWSEHGEPRRGRVPSVRGRIRRAMTRPVSARPKKRASTHLRPSVSVAGERRRSADVTRGLGVILVVLFLLVSSAAVGDFVSRWDTSSPIERSRSVIIGVPTDMWDMGLSQEAHRYGFAYDLANWLTDDLHYSAPTFYGFSAIDGFGDDYSEMVRSGQVDMFITPTARTGRREKDGSFAGPYMVTQGGVLVRADSTIQTIQDLAGKRVCTWRESTYREQSRRLGGSTPVEKDDLSSCVEALVTGGVDAVAGDQIILAEAARTEEEHELTIVLGVEFGGEQHYGIELKSGDIGECNEIREGIRRFITSGAWDRAFYVNMSYVVPTVWYKPDPNHLDRCE